MTSLNFTYEYDKDRCAWFIYDRNGKIMADATNEFNANLIVEAFNGCN